MFPPVTVMSRRLDVAQPLRRCAAAMVVSDSEFSVLLGVRHRTSSPLRDVRCELETGHGGVHAGFVMAAEDGEQWWWLCWDALDRQVETLDVCAAVEDVSADDCLLPTGHAGAHSVEL
ncbi:MAG TPA: hypothetical protein VF657_05870 [Actinoplanes sp.]|jgi:hypothetical protein